MHGRGQDEVLLLTAHEFAGRVGLSIRALRLYEKHGLITPRRTSKQWRLYGSDEAARLNEIMVLKSIGLSLRDISKLLRGQPADLAQILTLQRDALSDTRSRAERGLIVIEALQAKIRSGTPASVDDLITLAKETNMAEPPKNTVAWRRYEQARPRTEQKIDPALYLDYDGYYLLDTLAYVITQRGNRLFARLTGQAELEIFPEDVDVFFYKAVQAQLTFTRNESGAVSGLVLHQNGYEQAAPRVEKSVVTALEEALAERIRDKRQVQNSKALLQEIIDQHQRGEPDYERMTPPLATAAREQSAMIQAELERMGPLKDMSFKGVTDGGWDVYDVSFDKGHLEWSFTLAADGRFSGIFIRPSL